MYRYISKYEKLFLIFAVQLACTPAEHEYPMKEVPCSKIPGTKSIYIILYIYTCRSTVHTRPYACRTGQRLVTPKKKKGKKKKKNSDIFAGFLHAGGTRLWIPGCLLK